MMLCGVVLGGEWSGIVLCGERYGMIYGMV